MDEICLQFIFPSIIENTAIDRISVPVPIDVMQNWTLDTCSLCYSSDISKSVFQTIVDNYCVFDAAIIAEYYHKKKCLDNDSNSEVLFRILQLAHQEIHKALDTKLYAFIATLYLYSWYIHEDNQDIENMEQIHSFIEEKYNKHINFMFRNSKIDINAGSDVIIQRLRTNLDKINEWRNSRISQRCFAAYYNLEIANEGRYANWDDCFSLMAEKWNLKKRQRCISVSKKNDGTILYSISGIDCDIRKNAGLARRIEDILRLKTNQNIIRRSYNDSNVRESVFCYIDNFCGHHDVSFYYTTYQYLLEKNYLATSEYNRLFTCCERKLFEDFANSSGEIIVAAQSCSICAKVAQTGKYKNINIGYLVAQENDEINTTDWYNALTEDARKNHIKVINDCVYCQDS